jgi:hypothetical protein
MRARRISLHGRHRHAGIVACTQDDDDNRLAAAIDAAVRQADPTSGVLIRVNRGG